MKPSESENDDVSASDNNKFYFVIYYRPIPHDYPWSVHLPRESAGKE